MSGRGSMVRWTGSYGMLGRVRARGWARQAWQGSVPGKEVFIEIAIFRLTFYEVFMKVDLVRHCVLR